MNRSLREIDTPIVRHDVIKVEKHGKNVFEFYRGRIASCPSYGFRAGHEILHVITRCAFYDSMLTDKEFNSIIILAERAHIKMMEDNYNAGWENE